MDSRVEILTDRKTDGQTDGWIDRYQCAGYKSLWLSVQFSTVCVFSLWRTCALLTLRSCSLCCAHTLCRAANSCCNTGGVDKALLHKHQAHICYTHPTAHVCANWICQVKGPQLKVICLCVAVDSNECHLMHVSVYACPESLCMSTYIHFASTC